MYLLVGGVATLSEWGMFYVFDRCAMHYMVATVVAYLISTFLNWLIGRALVFRESQQTFWKEIAGIYLASLIGLALNVLLMYIGVEFVQIEEMWAKIFATAIVFVYNFTVRKICIYRL